MTLPRILRPLLQRLAPPLAACILLVVAGGAWTQQQRPVQLPANATYGEMKAFQHPAALIDKKTLRLAPGARVYNESNLIITPSMVPAQAKVLYRLDINGQISHMWLLTQAEAKAAKQRAKSAKP